MWTTTEQEIAQLKKELVDTLMATWLDGDRPHTITLTDRQFSALAQLQRLYEVCARP